jgi:hypothetical protein
MFNSLKNEREQVKNILCLPLDGRLADAKPEPIETTIVQDRKAAVRTRRYNKTRDAQRRAMDLEE